ncbi:MAG TPA: amidohydrolase family protein [Planctomycetota bacterium]
MTIDIHVNLSRWSFRRVRGDASPTELADLLRERGVTEAWAGSFDALLHRDVAAVNARLADDCRRDGLLVPFGTVDPTLPDWEEDLRRCHEDHRMPGIRLHPGWHGYTLDDPRFVQFVQQATERRLIVQIALRMEDERTQHPRLNVPEVDPAPLLEAAVPKARLVLLNAHRNVKPELLGKLAAAGVAGFDLAGLEGMGGVESFAKRVGIERVLFGSFFPLFTWESASLKLRESGLAPDAERAIRVENARRLRTRS